MSLGSSRIIRDSSLQALGKYASAGLMMLRGLALAAILGPHDLGIVALIGIVLAYTQFADLGIGLAIGREIPLSRGAGHDEEVRRWYWIGLLARLVGTGVVGLVLAVVSGLGRFGSSSSLDFGLRTAAVVAVLQGTVLLNQATLQALQRFGRSAAIMVVLAVALLAGTVGSAAAWGVRGAFVGQLLGFALAAVVAFVLRGRWRPVHLQRRWVVHMLAVGFPLACLDLVGYNLIYVDQAMTAALLGTYQLGVYTPALYAGSIVALFPGVVAAVVGPRLIRRFGEAGRLDSIREFTWRPVWFLSVWLPPAVALVWVTAPPLIERYLPDYRGSIAPLRVYVVGAFFLGLNLGASSTLLALNKHRYNIPILAGCLALNVVLDLAFVRGLGFGLVGIALGSLLTYATYWMVHTAMVRLFLGQSLSEAIVANLRSGSPGLLLIGFLIIAWRSGTLDQGVALVGFALLAVSTALAVVRWHLGFEGGAGLPS